MEGQREEKTDATIQGERVEVWTDGRKKGWNG